MPKKKFDPVAFANALSGKVPKRLRSEKLRLKALDIILNIAIPFNRWLGLRLKEFTHDRVVVESPPSTLRKNHVGTTHARAQALMGEYSAGLLVAQNYPIAEHRMIISQLNMEYRKAGAGTLRAEALAPDTWPDISDEPGSIWKR